MTYDEHGPWGEPGPVSGVDWVEACLCFSTGLVDPSRLLIGLPAYGYDWDLTASDPENGIYSAEYVSWRDFPFIESQLGVTGHWDASSQSPYLYYTRDGHEHVLWYEVPMSIAYKLALIAQYQLAGLSVWALGLEDIHFWQGIAEELTG
jgi:spore germination protein YaaH